MLDKASAAAQLTEEKLPLFTPEITKTLAAIRKGPPDTSTDAVLELIKRHPDHFADLIRRRTQGHTVKGRAVWLNPDTDSEFHDIDVEIVCRYLRAGFSLEDRFMQLPHARFIARYGQFLDRKQSRDLEEAEKQDEERFFSFPNAFASADCWYDWSRLPFLTADECAALALGRDPEIVSLSKAETVVGDGKSVFLEEYRKTKRIFDRYRVSKGLAEGQISFLDFKEWMKSAGIAVPTQAVERSTKIEAASKGVAEEKEKVSTVNSLYKLMFAFAVRQYPDLIERMNVHTPGQKDPKGSVYIDIEKELRPINSKINDGTIKKYLWLAYLYLKEQKLLPPEKKQKAGKIPEKSSSFQK